MDPSITELLSTHYTDLRDSFRAGTSRFLQSHDQDDAFHHWCYTELQPPPRHPVPHHYDDLYASLRSHARKLRRATPKWLAAFPTADLEPIPVSHRQPPELPIEPDATVLSTLMEHLTPRQMEVLLALKETHTPESASELLGVSIDTIKRRTSDIRSRLSKLGQRIKRALMVLLHSRAVFVSSTYTDLKDHRAAVVAQIHKLAANGMPIVVYAMEYFLTGRGHPGKRCLQLVRRSDIYVGIFANRYGSMWTQRDLSFTEAEFREAEEMTIDCSIYAPTNAHAATLPAETAPRKKKRIRLLKEYVYDNYVVEQFDSPEELASRVASKLSTMFWS